MLKLNQPEVAWFLERTGDPWRSDNFTEFGIESRSAEIPESLFNLDVNLILMLLIISFHGFEFVSQMQGIAGHQGMFVIKGADGCTDTLPKKFTSSCLCERKTTQKIAIYP